MKIKLTTREKDTESTKRIKKYLKNLKKSYDKGGIFFEKDLKHGASPKGIGASAANLIHKTMNAKKVEVLTYQRKALVEMFGPNGVEPPGGGRPPKLKQSVVEHLKRRGITTRHFGGFIEFRKRTPKKIR